MPTKQDRSMSEVPVKERRLALLKLLRAWKATTEAKARGKAELAKKLGYTEYDVYCLCYHKYPLAKAGFVRQTTREDGPAYYLTAKGVKEDPQ